MQGRPKSLFWRKKKWLQPPEVGDTETLDFSYEVEGGVRKAKITLVDGSSVRRRISSLVGREIKAPCFIVEGSVPERPRAFGILWQVILPQECPNYRVETVDNVSLFFAKDVKTRQARELRMPRAQLEAQKTPEVSTQPASPSIQITISAETKEQAHAALEKAKRYGGDVEANEKATPVIKLLQQVIKGRCPSHRELRITKSMEHGLRKSVVRGGVRTLFEDALPILSRLAEEVEELRGSGQT